MGPGPLTMSSTEPSLRLLPPWERSVSTVSCTFPSWRGRGESKEAHCQPATAPRQTPQGMMDTAKDT